jgi:uncharacterized membrane protein
MFRGVFNHLFIPAGDPSYIRILLGVISLIGLILRLYIINNPIGYDEAYTFINFSSKPLKFILADYHAPNNHIFNSLLIGAVYRIFGNHIWIVRLPALLAGVLAIPAAFFASRRFFTAQQSLAASAVLAVAPNIVAASANGRGYTLIILFSLLLVNFAGILVKQRSRSALIAYAITGALGFYSIPIFLYPMAGISLWVAVTYLSTDDSRKIKWINLREFLVTCVVSGMLTLLLYSPVIFFGTGFDSIIANDIVKSQSWIDFADNLVTRSSLTWQNWMAPFALPVRYLFLFGFLLSLFQYRKISNQKLPIQLFIFLGTVVMLFFQRVAPLPRIWGYLEMFYLVFSAIGIVGMGQMIVNQITDEQKGKIVFSSIVLVTVLIVSINVTLKTQSRQARLNRTVAPELFAADYLAKNLTNNDTIVSVAPTDIQTAYYLKINGKSYDYFYQRDRPVEIQNAVVLVRTRGESKFDTLDEVLDFFDLTNSLDMAAGQQVFDYGPLFIYSIPSK